jgi:hypothetical protein
VLFGSRDTFAVEAEFLAREDKWILGRLRLWVKNAALGDFEDTCSLDSSARWGRVFLRASPRRSRPDLDRLSAEQVFEALYGRYVGPQDVSPGPWDQDPYVLDELGEASLRDREAVVVVRRSDETDRLVWRSLRDGEVREAVVGPGICDRVIREYCDWIDSIGSDAGAR